ncbi:MAG: hypothetical protein V5A47_03430 [Bacteroidales bacterium]|nr:hypothetical protein [Bacteroidales bacterium]
MAGLNLKRIIPAGVILFFVSMALFSCVEDNFTDIRWDPEDHWKPDLSVPIGDDTVDVNNYFKQYREFGDMPGTIFPVYYEDSLYPLIDARIATEDSFDYSLANHISSSRYIEYLSIHLRTWNTYPTESRVQMYFRKKKDGDWIVLDSLFEASQIIESGEVDEENKVIRPAKQEFSAAFDQEQIDEIVYPSENLLVKAYISVTTEDLDTVRFYSDYAIRMEATARVKLNIRPSDLGY